MIYNILSSDTVAFVLIYLTFFLDNVLLTVLVPLLPELLGGDVAEDNISNSSVMPIYTGVGQGAGAAAGFVLSARAFAQLSVAPTCARAVCSFGAIPVLRAATFVLGFSAFALSLAASLTPSAALTAWMLGAARFIQGVGGAAASVSGLALASTMSRRAVPALLGAVALGVLFGYPFGGVVAELRSRSAPFLIISAVLVINFALQCRLLDKSEFNQRVSFVSHECEESNVAVVLHPCAGAVFLTTAVMAALEPCLPIYVMERFHSERWTLGTVFVSDSLGYLAASCLAGELTRYSPQLLAFTGQLALGLAAVLLPCVRSTAWLSLPQSLVGVGLGLVDVSLEGALLAGSTAAPGVAAKLQQAAAAANGFAPAIGGLAAWWFGFGTLMRTLGVANLLYTFYLYRVLAKHPFTQWETNSVGDTESLSEDQPLKRGPGEYLKMKETNYSGELVSN